MLQPSRIALAVATALACGTALAAPTGKPGPAPSKPVSLDASDFKPTSGCEKLEGYDPQWANHGDDYGLNQPEAKADKPKGDKDKNPQYVWGFYQMHEHDGTLYAAFGGKMTKNVTPGALVALDADTLALKNTIKLPFATHALALSQDGKRAIATHTYVNAFSLVNLADGKITCRKADTDVKGQKYRGRYVVLDEAGNFYINYNTFAPGKPPSYLMKYTPEGEHAPGFAVQSIGNGLVIPLAYLDGQVLTGTHSVTAVDPKTGAPTPLTGMDEGLNVYNYVAGPGKQLLASVYGVGALPNLLLIDPATGARSSLLTGSGTVEVGYSPESGQVFSTNYESRTLTVASLPTQATGFVPGQFVNIAFQDSPSNLHVRHTANGTDVYLTTKDWEGGNATRGARLHRVHIAPSVQGIDGLDKPDACTVTTFDMRDRSVSSPVACKLLDPKATWKVEYERAGKKLPDLQQSLRRAVTSEQDAKVKLKKAQAQARKLPGKANTQAVKDAQQEVKQAQMLQGFLKDQMPAAEAGLRIFQRMAGQ